MTRWRTPIALIALGLVSTVAILLVWLVWKFPFRRGAIVRRAENSTGARVEIGAFHETWLPPGFTAEKVRVSDRDGNVLTVAAIALKGSYTGFLRTPKSVPEIQASGARLVLRAERRGGAVRIPGGSGARANIAVGEIRLTNSQIDFLPRIPGKPPLSFMIRELNLKHVGDHNPVDFHVALHNPRPPGEIRADGRFGPMNQSDAGSIPVSGAFTYEHADLTVERAISGTLNASGNFHGRLGSIECAGTADVPRFQVFGSAHAVHIAARFDATVDATTGNAMLRRIVSHFEGTTVSATGSVAPAGDRPGKKTTLDLAIHQGRLEDLLLLFTRNQPAMTGAVDLEGKFTIPPGPPGFLTRLGMKGAFTIANGYFTNPKAQTPIDRLSASAEGESKRAQAEHPVAPPALIRASVLDNNGIASLPDVSFQAPGMRAQLEGTFTLRDKGLNFNGVLQTAGKLSDTTSGIKALMVKALGILWPRNASVKSIPFHIGGKAAHPVFRLRIQA